MRIVALWLIICQTALCGFEQKQMGCRHVALGSSSVALADEVWAITYNPAGLTQLSAEQISFFYSPQPYGFSELSLKAVAAAMSTRLGVVGTSLYSYGFELYREISGTLSYAIPVSRVSVGLNLTYNSVSIQNYGSSGTFGIDMGFYLPIFSGFTSGVFFRNLNAPTIGAAGEKLPQSFDIGCAYSPMSTMHLTVDYQKEIGHNAVARFGIEYWIVDWVALRGGMSEEPAQSTGGFGVSYSFFQFDYAAAYHQELGWTHQASITIRWGGDHE